jgi:hypothetical protein
MRWRRRYGNATAEGRLQDGLASAPACYDTEAVSHTLRSRED